MMDPSLIVFGIRALLRIEHEGEEAYSQYVRDQDVLFPEPELPDYRSVDFLRDTFVGTRHAALIGTDASGQPGPLARYWSEAHNGANPAVPGAHDVLYLAAAQIKADEVAQAGKLLSVRSREAAGARILKQWAKDKQPVGPIARFALTIADVSLEYVGANPSIFGIGGNGEKLIGALAGNLASMIPDDGNQFGPQSQLAETTIAIFLHAGLKAINDHPDLVVSKPQWQSLIQHTLPPLVNTLPKKLSEQSDWREVGEALLGPAAKAAIGTFAENPMAWFGSRFDSNEAVGALTQALLSEASARGLKDQFSESGFVALYRAALGVAVSRPELFIGRADGKPVQAIATDLLRGVADTLKTAPSPFNGDVGAQLAATALDALKQHGPCLFDAANPWEGLAATLTVQVVDGLNTALQTPRGALANLLAPQRLIEFARPFLVQVAKTPGMLVPGNSELQHVVAAVASAMGQDTDLLLAPDDWLGIAAVVAEETAANPQRLLKLVDASAGTKVQTLCAALITGLLGVAAAEPKDRTSGGVLFGATLRDAITIALRTAAGNPDLAITNAAAMATLLRDLAARVRAEAGSLGSKELLWLYRSLIGRAVQSGPVALTNELVAGVLNGEVPA